MLKIIVVLGCVGSGKSLQTERVVESGLFGKSGVLHHVSVGAHLRAIRKGLESSKYAHFINDPHAPSPLPIEIINGVLFEIIEQLESGIVLLDGYPRHGSGVDDFLKALTYGGHDFLGGVYLNVSQETSMSRLVGRGPREGERMNGLSLKDFVLKRYQTDAREIDQVVAKLGKVGPIHEIDANRSIDEVGSQFQAAMRKIAGNLDRGSDF